MHAACLPALRRVSEERLSGHNPLLGWGAGEGFLQCPPVYEFVAKRR